MQRPKAEELLSKFKGQRGTRLNSGCPRPGKESPDDSQKFLLHSEDGQILSLLQNGLLLGKLAAGFALFLHVICKLLLCPENTKEPHHPARSPTLFFLSGLLPFFQHPERELPQRDTRRL